MRGGEKAASESGERSPGDERSEAANYTRATSISSLLFPFPPGDGGRERREGEAEPSRGRGQAA